MTTNTDQVYVKVPPGDGREWRNEPRRFGRIPQVGEYVCLAVGEKAYRVTAVVHCPFEGGESIAEVYTEAQPVAVADIVADQARAMK